MSALPPDAPWPTVSVVLPVFDEEENVGPLAQEITAALEGSSWTWEVVFVDDGSRDGTASQLASISRADPRFRWHRLARNVGQSGALVAGFRLARGDLVVTLDADRQNDPADIPRLLAMTSDYDLVSGIRARRRDSWRRRVASRIANRVRSAVVGDQITDVGCSLKVYRREMLLRAPVFDGMHRFLPALVTLQGARVAEAPVNHRPRTHGRSKYTIGGRLRRVVADLLGVRWLQTRFIDPELLEMTPEPPSDDPSGE